VNPWGNSFDARKLNSSEGGKGDTTAVGSYPADASPYGVLDMAGNVSEWVADSYAENYEGLPRINPTGPSSGLGHVVRGGCWFFERGFARSANRLYDEPSRTIFDVGFRCAK
jgi:formylglycine-generating enzyme required for sulfatase activity